MKDVDGHQVKIVANLSSGFTGGKWSARCRWDERRTGDLSDLRDLEYLKLCFLLKSLKVAINAQGMMGPPGDNGPLGLEGPQVRLALQNNLIFVFSAE